VSEKRIAKERIQLYLKPEICAWLASQAEGRNKPAGEALESWIVEKEYATVRDRYCRGLSDAQILKLDRSEIAEMAEDDDIPLVWMILQGGAQRAVAAGAPVMVSSPYGDVEFTAESALAMFEAYLNGGDELGYVAEKDVIAAIKFLRGFVLRESVPVIPERSPAVASTPMGHGADPLSGWNEKSD
jgi:hypothetical protein